MNMDNQCSFKGILNFVKFWTNGEGKEWKMTGKLSVRRNYTAKDGKNIYDNLPIEIAGEKRMPSAHKYLEPKTEKGIPVRITGELWQQVFEKDGKKVYQLVVKVDDYKVDFSILNESSQTPVEQDQSVAQPQVAQPTVQVAPQPVPMAPQPQMAQPTIQTVPQPIPMAPQPQMVAQPTVQVAPQPVPVAPQPQMAQPTAQAVPQPVPMAPQPQVVTQTTGDGFQPIPEGLKLPFDD